MRPLLALLLAGCASATTTGGLPITPPDAGTTTTDAGEQPACAITELPNAAALEPVPGELFYTQLGLGGIKLGEAAILVGPDGTTALIDVGNSSHDDDVSAALAQLETSLKTAGFGTRPANTLEYAILTHHHSDHESGLAPLLDKITISRAIVHRGLVDITDAANAGLVEELCTTLAAHAAVNRPLCEGRDALPCSQGSWNGTYPGIACAGLTRGNLLVDGDDGASSYLPLGESARITFAAADATIGGDRYPGTINAIDSNGENARSVVGLIAFGAFRMIVAGDLTGGGSDTDPVEAFIADRLGSVTDLDNRGADVVHASHHGRDTSSSKPWLDRLAPKDGRHRNALAGISTAHLGSPHASVTEAYLDGRLAQGQFWVTRVSAGGSERTGVVNADGGRITIRTENKGLSYLLQATGADGHVIRTVRTTSVRTCR